jgi:hypothetical protein
VESETLRLSLFIKHDHQSAGLSFGSASLGVAKLLSFRFTRAFSARFSCRARCFCRFVKVVREVPAMWMVDFLAL